ncbi:MAG: UMP kinase [Spirochaetaceae bacterium]|nr:UMP kinase [Spirochaetaceae bacterium]
MTKVISLGGSLIAPNLVDENFINNFKEIVINFLNKDKERRLILVTGGGATARSYQNALRALAPAVSNDELDWLGIAATKINAALIKAVFADYCPEPIADNPETAPFNKGRILVASGWKPGFSTDYDAAVLAGRFGGKVVINLSNIDYLYDSDPKTNSNAQKITHTSWNNLTAMLGTTWLPGSNLPFDPIAALLAKQHGLTAIIAGGTNFANIEAILEDKEYLGTTIN